MVTVLDPESPAAEVRGSPVAPVPAVAAATAAAPAAPRWNPRQRSKSRFLVNLALGATLMALVHLFVVQISVVRGHSMEPALLDGDRLVVDRVTCTLGQVQRNEIVVLRCPRNTEVDYVKRVIGLPGDRIEMHKGRVFVNGELLTGDYQPVPDEAEVAELTVPDGHYYVLGDNRPVSCDSREFGLVAQELLRGRVRARFWPPDRLAVF